MAAPTVKIDSPLDRDIFYAPASVLLSAVAKYDSGEVVKVEFYEGNVKLGEDNTSPYSFLWEGVDVGLRIVTARLYQSTGEVVNSEPVLIIVLANKPPKISEIHDVSVTKGNYLPPISFRICDEDAGTENTTVTVITDNLELIPALPAVEAPRGFNRRERLLRITPNPDAVGVATVTIKVEDQENGVAETSFLVSVIDRSVKEFLPENIRELPLFAKSIDLLDWLIQAKHFDNIVKVENLYNVRSVYVDDDYLLRLLTDKMSTELNIAPGNKEALVLLAANIYNLKGTKRGLMYILNLLGLKGRIMDWREVNADLEAAGVAEPLPPCAVLISLGSSIQDFQDSVYEAKVDRILRYFFWMCLTVQYAWTRTIEDEFLIQYMEDVLVWNAYDDYGETSSGGNFFDTVVFTDSFNAIQYQTVLDYNSAPTDLFGFSDWLVGLQNVVVVAGEIGVDQIFDTANSNPVFTDGIEVTQQTQDMPNDSWPWPPDGLFEYTETEAEIQNTFTGPTDGLDQEQSAEFETTYDFAGITDIFDSAEELDQGVSNQCSSPLDDLLPTQNVDDINYYVFSTSSLLVAIIYSGPAFTDEFNFGSFNFDADYLETRILSS